MNFAQKYIKLKKNTFYIQILKSLENTKKY